MKQEVKLSLLRIYISHGVPEGLESLRNLENHLLAMLCLRDKWWCSFHKKKVLLSIRALLPMLQTLVGMHPSKK